MRFAFPLLMAFTVGFGVCYSLLRPQSRMHHPAQFTRPRRPWPVAEGLN